MICYLLRCGKSPKFDDAAVYNPYSSCFSDTCIICGELLWIVHPKNGAVIFHYDIGKCWLIVIVFFTKTSRDGWPNKLIYKIFHLATLPYEIWITEICPYYPVLFNNKSCTFYGPQVFVACNSLTALFCVWKGICPGNMSGKPQRLWGNVWVLTLAGIQQTVMEMLTVHLCCKLRGS